MESISNDDHGERIEVDGDDDNIMVGDAEGKSHGDNDDDDDDDDDDEDDSEDSESRCGKIHTYFSQFYTYFSQRDYDTEIDDKLSLDRSPWHGPARPTQASYNKPDNWRERNRIGL